MLTWYRKVSNLKRTVSTILFTGNESDFKISFQNYYHQAYRKVNHQSYKSHIQIKVIVKCNLILIYNYSIWLLKWKYAGHNTPTVNGVYEPSFLTDSSLTQGIIHPLSMVCTNLHFLLILHWRGVLCPAHLGSPTASPSRFYLTSSNKNGSAPKKRVINHF